MMLLLLFLAMDPQTLSRGPERAPVPIATWKVPFRPETALLRADGGVILFHGSEIYTYGPDGELDQNHRLDVAPDSAYLGPGDSIWLAYKGLLGVLNENNNMLWQRAFPASSLTPFAFDAYLVYVSDKHLMLLDPSDGQTRFSLVGGQKISGVRPDGDQLLIFDDSGSVISWDPISGQQHAIIPQSGQRLRFISPAPDGGWVLVYDQGILKRIKPDGDRLWQREFHIDIPTEPMWLAGDEKMQLLVSSQSRRVVAYNHRGIPLVHYLLSGRPKQIIRWSESGCLLVPGLVNELIWYEALERRFYKQAIESYVTLMAENGIFVLLVDNDAIIRLYKRALPLSRK